ncbi:MAG: MG2 domain-containing protein, partial [Methanosarcinales archaeon]
MKSAIKTVLILTILLALFSFVSGAQTCNINIYGTVKDWKGNNLYGAKVDLYINGNKVASDRTDNGKYIIEYNLRVEEEGKEWKIIATYGGNSVEKTGIIQCSKSNKIDLTIGNFGLVSKRVSEDLLIYGLDLETGKSIEGVHITIANSSTPDQIIKEGVTNKDGVFRTKSLGTNLIVTGKYGSNTVTVKPYYYAQGYEDKVYIYTDRPIYRPYQKVFFKVVVWNNTAGNFSISKDVQCNLKIYTPKRDSIYKKEFITNEFGSFSGNITLSEEPPLGRYQIEVSLYGKKYYGSFEVQEYKKPEYKVDLTPEKKVYINGETAKINLKAEYYFGKPVKNADVVYKVSQQYYYPPCKGYDCYYISSPRIVPPPYYPQKPIISGKTKTDNNGIAKIEFKVQSEYESNVIVEAEVIDESRRSVSGSTSLRVAPALFKLEIRT